jgi:hypothetical protein
VTAVDLGYRPRPWQRECHQRMARFTVLALHRRAGKTEMALMQLLDRALRCREELGLFAYLAPFLKQSRAIAWARLKQRVEALRVHGAVDVIESEMAVRLKHNNATVRLFGGDNPDALRGLRLDGVVIDEVAQIRPEVWEDILLPALADRRGWSLFIGTPAGVNLFSELFYRAQTLPDWHSARYTVYDTDALDPDEVARMKRDMSDTSFAREMLCDFSAAGVDQLISLATLEDAARRTFKPGEQDYAPRIIGVDPARFGDDRSVIFQRQGLQAFTPHVYRGIDNMELASRVAHLIEAWRPDAVFVDAGAGAGVIDRLRQLGHDVIEVPFGGRASRAEFANKRVEMWFGMRDWLTQGGAIPGDIALRQDLGAPTYWYDAQGRAQLEAKDDIKKRGLPSPDLGDALALTFAHPVAPRRTLPSRRREHDPLAEACLTRERRDYDPLALV